MHDIKEAEGLVAQIEPQALLADKGYDSDEFVESLGLRSITPVIPPKSNRKTKRQCDFALYCERNLIEKFFNLLKQFRGIATRYEKTQKLSRGSPSRLRASLAQMTTRPSRGHVSPRFC